MKIDVRDQVSLPLHRCVHLCVHGIRHRLFRSAITVVIVALAVAFLMMMLSASYIDRQVGRDVRGRTGGRHLLEDWVDKLSVPMNAASLMGKLASAVEGDDRWRELQAWGELTDEQLTQLVAVARQQKAYERFFDTAKPGERSLLVGARENEAIFEYLLQPGKLDDFLGKLPQLTTPFVTDAQAFQRFLQEYSQSSPVRQKILSGQAAAVAGLKSDLHGQSALDLLAAPDRRALDLLTRHHFVPDARELSALSAEAVLARDAKRLTGLLRDKRMRGVIAGHAGVSVPDVAEMHLYEIGSASGGAKWLLEEVERTRTKAFEKQVSASAARASAKVEGTDAQLKIAKLAPGELSPEALNAFRERLKAQNKEGDFTLWLDDQLTPSGASPPSAAMELARQAVSGRWDKGEYGEEVPQLSLAAERIVEVCRAQSEQARLTAVEAKLGGEVGEGWMGFSGRTGWLIIISFVVCVVGVANAMLMSVTERFREIATMKCLGALDSFIMIIFVMESAMQGLAGGLIGVVIGLLLGVLRSCWGLGTLALTNLPVLAILASAGVCVVSGGVLASLAAVYPAWVAARLAPMEAMRIE